MTTQQISTFNICKTVGFEDAQKLLNDGEAFIDQSDSDIQFDFGALKVSNSILVAMMMCWYRKAELDEKKITFLNLPSGVQKIVDISGLSGTLPID